MILAKYINQYSDNNVQFCEPVKNNILSHGNFIRIIYSTQNFSLNGIFIHFVLNNYNTDVYYNKYKITFNVNTNINLIEDIRKIERTILDKYSICNKTPQYKIYEHLLNGNLKIINDEFGNMTETNGSFVLKISGLWENETNIGLTYKFLNINHPL